MRTRLLIALAVLVSGALLQMGSCGCRPARAIVERADITIRTVQHGVIPLSAKGSEDARQDVSHSKSGVERSRIENANYIERGSFDQGDSEAGVFRVDPDGKTATQVRVRFGVVTPELIEIKEGLREGDQVIVSDMSRWSNADRIVIE
jgi:hypothetical protein